MHRMRENVGDVCVTKQSVGKYVLGRGRWIEILTLGEGMRKSCWKMFAWWVDVKSYIWRLAEMRKVGKSKIRIWQSVSVHFDHALSL